ncbi:MAG: helix-turn-helix domain-containing protein [Amphiplicatus sp.]
MSSDVGWIKAALKRTPGKTQVGMAEALGVNRSAVTRLLNGDRQLKFHEAEKIAAYLGVALPIGLSDRGREFAGPGAPMAAVSEDAPVYRAAADGGRWSLARHETPIDYRPRAPHFEKAATVFGLYAPDDAMAPRFLPGEIVWVDPARPARPGDDALLVEKRRGKGPETVILAKLAAISPNRIDARQYRDGNEIRLDARRWSALHVLARY